MSEKCRKCPHVRDKHVLHGCDECPCRGEFVAPANTFTKGTGRGGGLLGKRGADGGRKNREWLSRASKAGSVRGGKMPSR